MIWKKEGNISDGLLLKYSAGKTEKLLSTFLCEYSCQVLWHKSTSNKKIVETVANWILQKIIWVRQAGCVKLLTLANLTITITQALDLSKRHLSALKTRYFFLDCEYFL